MASRQQSLTLSFCKGAAHVGVVILPVYRQVTTSACLPVLISTLIDSGVVEIIGLARACPSAKQQM